MRFGAEITAGAIVLCYASLIEIVHNFSNIALPLFFFFRSASLISVGNEVSAFTHMPPTSMRTLPCAAPFKHSFMEAIDEDRKHAM